MQGVMKKNIQYFMKYECFLGKIGC